jgi:hypothetical protein
MSAAVAGPINWLPRGGARLRAPATADQTIAAPVAAEPAVASQPVLPDALALGESVRLPDGLEFTVTGIGTQDSDPRHVVIEVRVANTSDHGVEFENDFGVVDAAGTAHRYSWVNAATYPDVLPGIATLEPGAFISGKAHVLLPELPSDALATLRPAFLDVINSGCGGCNHEVVFLPRVLWQASKPSPPKPAGASAAVLP